MKLKAIGDWFESRLQLESLYRSTAGHLIPRSSASWWYVFGSATLVCFVLQIVTGICLALVYVPSAADAWTSLEFLNYQQSLGWYLRAVHFWGSNLMVALMTVHMIQVFLMGAHKYPRELTWVIGCMLFIATLGMAFTGQVMRFDQDAYWGLGIGVAIMGRIPLIGDVVADLILAGPIIGAETLSRFFTLHVFVVPGLIIALVTLHLRLVLKRGINDFPVRGKGVVPEVYDEEYAALIEKEGIPFFPDGVDKDIVFSAVVIIAILCCAAIFGPAGPNGEPDPTLIDTVPRPDFYFLSLFALLALMPPQIETFVLVYVMPVAILLLFLVPFIAGRGAKHPADRPIAVLGVVLIGLTMFTLAWLGISSPWSPHMDAWSGDPTPVAYVKESSPLELQGAVLVQAKQCRNCHALGGVGGQRGPALDDVATRLTADQLTRQILQGGGNMPAYGKHLSPYETTALVAFLRTMHPSGEPGAR